MFCRQSHYTSASTKLLVWIPDLLFLRLVFFETLLCNGIDIFLQSSDLGTTGFFDRVELLGEHM